MSVPTISRALGLAVVAVVVTAAPVRQTAGSAAIDGTLVDAATSTPERRARVTVSGPAVSAPQLTVTDDDGRFSFTHLPAGVYRLTASKTGYLDSTFGQKRPGDGRAGTPLVLAEGQRVERLALRIARAGVVTGVVTDDAGDPVRGTPVSAYQWVMTSGERALTPVNSAEADDLGVYRIAGLGPGDYVIGAVPRSEASLDKDVLKRQIAQSTTTEADRSAAKRALPGILEAVSPPTVYGPVYFPGTRSASSAMTVTLDISEEKAGLDLHLQAIPSVRVTGTVVTSHGLMDKNIQVTLRDAADAAVGLDASRGTSVGPDGAFSFGGVPAGRYELTARLGWRPESPVTAGGTAPRPQSQSQFQSQWASADLVVDGQTPAAATLVMHDGMTVSGRVTFDGSGTVPADLRQMQVSLEPSGLRDAANSLAASARGAVGADGSFAVTGVMPGRYRPTIGGARGWMPKSFVVNARDAMDFQIDVRPDIDVSGAMVTMTTRGTRLSGVLRDATGLPTVACTVIVFPQERNYWVPESRRIRATRPSTDGRYAFAALPPGTYWIVAVEDVEPGVWFDPAFLAPLTPMAVRITLGEGEQRSQDLRLMARSHRGSAHQQPRHDD